MVENTTKQSNQGLKLENKEERAMMAEIGFQMANLNPRVDTDLIVASFFEEFLQVLEDACLPADNSPSVALEIRLSQEIIEFDDSCRRHGIRNLNTVAEIADVLYFIALYIKKTTHLTDMADLSWAMVEFSKSDPCEGMHQVFIYCGLWNSEQGIGEYVLDVARLKYRAQNIKDIVPASEELVDFLGSVLYGKMPLRSEYDCANCTYLGSACAIDFLSQASASFGTFVWDLVIGGDSEVVDDDYAPKIPCRHFRCDGF